MELGSYDTSPRAISLKASDSGFLSAARCLDLDRRLQLDGAVALAAHHVVDVVRAWEASAHSETIVVNLVQQGVDLPVR